MSLDGLPHCDFCGSPPDTVLLSGEFYTSVMAACSQHGRGDWRDYPIPIDELMEAPEFWVGHLAVTKHPGVPFTLLEWADRQAPALSARLRAVEIEDPNICEFAGTWPPADAGHLPVS